MCDFLIYRAHHSCATKSNFGCHKTRGGKGERTTSSGASDERSTFGYGAVWHCPFHPWAGGTDDINDQFECQQFIIQAQGLYTKSFGGHLVPFRLF